jgi:hypothetical protein
VTPRRTASPAALAALALLACTDASRAQAPEFAEFSSRGLPRSRGIEVRVSHPPHWRRVETDDAMALAELRGSEGHLTGILQIGRGRRRADIAALCVPERALSLLGQPGEDTRVTDVVARAHQGRAAYEIRYERSDPPDFLVVRAVLVCLKDSQLVVSCAGTAQAKAAAAAIEPVCARVLESVSIAEE